MASPPPSPSVDVQGSLVDGLQYPTQELLLRILLYKTTFTGRGFRELAAREAPEVRDVLLDLAHESSAEAAAVTLVIREWDVMQTAALDIEHVARDTRTRFLRDLLTLKEGMTETGLAAAMRAPTDPLRQRLLKLVDIDRRHADRLRALLARMRPATKPEALGSAPSALGAHEGRTEGGSFSATILRRVEQLRAAGAEPSRIVVGPDGLRHLRDEGVLSADGRLWGSSLDVDMGWRGEVFAVETEDRIGYADILVEAAAHAESASS